MPKKQELFEIVRPVTPSEIYLPALAPKADEFHPVVLEKSALTPKADELPPVVLERSALAPKADENPPVVLDKSALTPVDVLLLTPPPPLPIGIKS
jgi:hypothetical protein